MHGLANIGRGKEIFLTVLQVISSGTSYYRIMTGNIGDGKFAEFHPLPMLIPIRRVMLTNSPVLDRSLPTFALNHSNKSINNRAAYLISLKVSTP